MNKPHFPHLQDKENLVLRKQELYTMYQNPVLSIQANDPSESKLSGWNAWINHTFETLITSKYPILFKERHFNHLGMITHLVIQEDPIKLKNFCIKLESTHSCGRAVDLDVFVKDRNLSRLDLEIDERKCFVCDEVARVCIRKQTHSKNEVISSFQNLILDSLQSKEDVIRFALLSECMLPIKFGLVTPLSNGVHHDMDIHTFLQSIDAIVPYFKEVDQLDRNQSLEDVFAELRQLGKRIETAMFEATGGINTHKGAIFLFLMILMAKRYPQPLHEALTALAQPLIQDFKSIDPHHPQSEGEKQYLKYNTQGIKGFVLAGGEPLISQTLEYVQSKPDSLHHQVNTLLKIMSQCDDSTIIKKVGLQGLKDFQYQAHLAFENPKVWPDFEAYCMHHHTSAGGSADIFAIIIYLTLSHERNLYEHY
jgi:holo-ACP synthase / triphosphoribosyl-dephospho-CoA synthase